MTVQAESSAEACRIVMEMFPGAIVTAVNRVRRYDLAALSVFETGFSLFSGESVESEGCSAPSARMSRGLNSGSGMDRGVKKS